MRRKTDVRGVETYLEIIKTHPHPRIEDSVGDEQSCVRRTFVPKVPGDDTVGVGV